MLKSSQSYIVSVDIDKNSDKSVIAVDKRVGNRLERVKTFIGSEAESIYNILTNTKIGGKRNE
ncbi:MAG: hypothetical protein K0S61_161 [Anaerocolumna sp.]|jgi:hypothetical protein|nr:hypothetical protein [Anaerocolumna sp.]